MFVKHISCNVLLPLTWIAQGKLLSRDTSAGFLLSLEKRLLLICSLPKVDCAELFPQWDTHRVLKKPRYPVHLGHCSSASGRIRVNFLYGL